MRAKKIELLRSIGVVNLVTNTQVLINFERKVYQIYPKSWNILFDREIEQNIIDIYFQEILIK